VILLEDDPKVGLIRLFSELDWSHKFVVSGLFRAVFAVGIYLDDILAEINDKNILSNEEVAELKAAVESSLFIASFLYPHLSHLSVFVVPDCVEYDYGSCLLLKLYPNSSIFP